MTTNETVTAANKTVTAVNETFICSFDNSYEFPLLLLTIVITIIVICECVLVISVIWRTKTLHTNTNILVASFTVTNIILTMAYILAQSPSMHANNTSNKLLIGISIGAINTSLTHMSFIAIDSYIHIAHPFYYIKQMTKGKILKIISAIWIFGLVFILIPLMAYSGSKYQKICFLLHPPLEYYFLGIVIYTVNIIVVFTSYLKIACLAFQHKRAANVRRLQSEDPDGAMLFRRNRTAAFRSVKYFAIMFGVFAFCTFPPTVVTGINQAYNLPRYILIPMMFMLLINAMVTVLIYVFISREFSKALRMTFSCMKQCCCKKIVEFPRTLTQCNKK